MRTIYADEMFLLNLVINYFIILATAKLCALPLERPRFWASAALGGLYSVLTLFPRLGFLTTPLMKLCLGMVMALIAFGGQGRLLRSFLAFLCVSAAFGGAVFAASMLAGVDMSRGLYISVSMRVLILSFALCYGVITLVFNRLGRRAQRQILKVHIKQGDREADFPALRDTGNELYDPLSGLPVMVISPEAAKKLLPSCLSDRLEMEATELLSAVPLEDGDALKLRLISYNAAGVGSGLMAVFRPDELSVDGKQRNDVLVGLSRTELCPDGEFSAIF